MAYRQLLMEAPLNVELPEIGPLPESDRIHTADENAARSFNWIMRETFHGCTYEKLMAPDPTVAPERVFFYCDHGMDVGTATARIMEDGIAKLHMVAVSPAYTGKGISRLLCIRVMQVHQALGFKSCRLETDDFRLSAIKTYLDLGFKPLYEAGDTEMEERWQKVIAAISAYKKKDDTPFPIYNGTAPDSDVCGDQQPTLKPYVVDGSKGAVIVCPGGGYQMLAYYEGDPIAKMITTAGVSAFVLKYRVLPFSSLETPIGDAKRAIRLVRSMGYEKVAILGFSAGGHLCAMAATKWDNGNPDAEDPIERFSSRPDAFIPCYGACSMYQFRKSEWMKQLFGEEASDFRKLIEYSAETLVKPDTPPAFIWQTSDDNVVVVNNSLLLAEALSANGVPYEMHLFPHGPHGVGLAPNCPDAWEWPNLCKAFLIRLGFGKENK